MSDSSAWFLIALAVIAGLGVQFAVIWLAIVSALEHVERRREAVKRS